MVDDQDLRVLDAAPRPIVKALLIAWALAAETVAAVALDQVPERRLRLKRQVAAAAVLRGPRPSADLLQLLHRAGIAVSLARQRYTLDEDADDAIARLPFPDPRLTLGEVKLLAKGKTKAHRKLPEQMGRIVK